MTETDAAADRASLVPGVHRLIRAIDGKEGPFAGNLVAFDDVVAVCVDVERLSEWAGWAFSDAEHVCGVLDVRRRADGHDALLPWCTQRVEAFLGRRSASESPLTPGELGTLVVSMLRGVRELGADGDAPGDWWLTGEGLPLFVHGDGGNARARTAALIERMARQQADRSTVRALEEMTAALRQPRHPADEDRRWEEQLFARAAPRALRLDVFAPERVSGVAPRLAIADAASSSGERVRRRRAEKAGRSPARPAEMWRYVTTGARRRGGLLRERLLAPPKTHSRPPKSHAGKESKVPRSTSSRRRSFVVAGGLGAAVLLVGLLWPTGDGDGPAEASSQKSVASEASARPTPAPEASEDAARPSPEPTPSEAPTPPKEGKGALDAAPALLEAIHACVTAGAESCPDAIAEGARTPADGVASLGVSASTATLVDDYGDVAVIRLTPAEAEGAESQGPEQMMVLERQNEIWLVRDVYDVADQPD